MTAWLVGVLAGALVTFWQYGRQATTARVAPPAVLRGLTVALIVALLLDAPAGTPDRPPLDVALDASESWLRGAPGCDRWRAAVDSAAAEGESVPMRFGDSVRVGVPRAAPPTDRASRVRAVVDRAAATGRPALVVTDGELDDADALTALPRGSRILALSCPPAPDAALASIESPRALLAGDTARVRVTIVAGGAGAPAGDVELRLDSLAIARAPHDALAPYAEQSVELRGQVGGAERSAVLRAVLVGRADAEPRNDTLGVGVDVSRAPGAVFVSTAPDYDAREAVAALRGVSALPTRAFYRVAPGAWRTDGTLDHADERAVRAAVRDAPLVVLHGDTAVFGAPRAATRGALLLFAPPSAGDGEWFAVAGPPSPLAAAVLALPLDSLPPLGVAPALPAGAWQGLVTRRGGASGERRPALVGWDSPRHVAVLGASGLWRWRFRGGAAAEAYGAFFGTLFDWLAAGRSDRRAAVPDAASLRAGAPIGWRRGAGADSVVTVTIARRSATGGVATVTLAFADGATLAESPPLAPGVYDARMPGGSVVLVVNASRELVPRRPSVSSGRVGAGSVAPPARSLRGLGWLYVLVVAMLAGEWLLRRRLGLR